MNDDRRARRIGLVAMVLALLPWTALAAQLTGGLTVAVADADGPLPGATVRVTHPEQRVGDYAERTDANGLAFFPVLPAGGGYVVEISSPGLGTVRLDAVRVAASGNRTLPVTLAGEYTERVRVLDRPPVVDLEKSATSTKFSDEFIHDLPVLGRFYQNVLTLAPGVQDADGDGNPNVHGSRARDFKALVNGVSNVDPLTGQYRANVNPNSIEEMEIITAGAGPEFGRAQGGYANILQKQGGNEFEGVFDAIYRTSALDGDGAVTVPRDRSPKFDWIQPSLQISGPIVKDRAWYRLSHEWIDRDDPINTLSAIEVVTQKQQISSDQITWQVSPRNKLAFKYDANPLDVFNFGVSSLLGASASQEQRFDAETYSMLWSAPYSPRVYVESLVAWQDGGFSILPAQRGVPNDCVAGPDFIEAAQCDNLQDGRTSGSYWRDFRDHRQRFTVKSDATMHLRERFLGMSHQFKFGLIVENERYVRDITERPRIEFEVFRPDPGNAGRRIDPIGLVRMEIGVPARQRARATGMTWGVYFKDQMKPAQNLTIEVGARLEREFADAPGITPFDPAAEVAEYEARRAAGSSEAIARINTFTAFEGSAVLQEQLKRMLNLEGNLNQLFGPVVNQSAAQIKRRRPTDIRLLNTNLAPFLAVSWDPWSDGKTKFALTAGRHYNSIPLIVPLHETAPAATSIDLRAQRLGGVWRVLDVTSVRGKMNPVANLNVIDHDLRTPYQDEFTFTFQRELWSETALNLSYVRRDYEDQLQDFDINHVSGDFGKCVIDRVSGSSAIDTRGGPDGIIDDCTGAYVAGEPEEGAPISTAPLLSRPDGVPDLYSLSPFWGSVSMIGNFNRARYEGVVLELVRRQYRGWEMQASYTWSMARGDGEDYDQLLGDDHSLRADEQGFQATDQRHVFKLAATTITPWGIRLGGTATWQSGLPYSVLAQRFSFETTVPALEGFGSDTAQSREIYVSGTRNDQRNVSYWDFGVKATREFSVRGGTSLQLSAEVFNLLNDGTYTIYNPFEQRGFRLNGNNDAYRRFGRRFQLGMRLAF